MPEKEGKGGRDQVAEEGNKRGSWVYFTGLDT